MLIVKVDSNIEKALKTLKSKVIRTKQMQRLVELKEFKKKSVVKRSQKESAKHKQYLRTLGE
jgi:ribosomal protein S21